MLISTSQRGFASIRMIMLMLMLIGAWAVYHAYKDGSLSSLLGDVASDYGRAMQDSELKDRITNSPLVERALDSIKR